MLELISFQGSYQP